MKKSFKYVIVIVAAVLIVILSLEIQKLDKNNAEKIPVDFNATAYARNIWDLKLPNAISNAPALTSLIQILDTQPEKAFKYYGRKLGISNTYYFLANGEGLIKSVDDENLVIDTEEGMQIQLATDFIFGNDVRDGSGIVDIDDFGNMTDFNNVSIELNNIVKGEIVPQLNKFAQPGLMVVFAGTFAINEKDIDTQSIRVVPVSIELSNDE